jgi:hypothetical protein
MTFVFVATDPVVSSDTMTAYAATIRATLVTASFALDSQT